MSFFSVTGLCKSQVSKCTSKADLPGMQLSRLFLYDYTTTTTPTTNNITFIRSYATQAHGHKPYITYKYTIRWLTEKQQHTSQNKQKNTDRDTKKKVGYTS